MTDTERQRPLVLVIEDDRELRRFYVEELERAGYTVAEAHNGLQAEAKAHELAPDVIVTDLGLPGIDGYELCRRLHRTERLASVPIVAITGRYFSAADVARARREGCQTVLIKPVAGEDLVAEIGKALGAR